MNPCEPVLELTRELVSRPSVTPEDAGCQELLRTRLEAAGFLCETMRFGDVANLWATRGSMSSPLFAFAGHTDVVPPGSLSRWSSDPFVPTIRDGFLYGRGAADMKSSLAAMIVAAERFFERHPDPRATVAFLLTSDEEGTAIDGTKRVIETLSNRAVAIDYCLVGEPSSTTTLADLIRVGRRGSLTGRLKVHGRQGHVAYPEATPNPIHASIKALASIVNRKWDQGNERFPATSFQIANLRSGTGAANVIPGELYADFNLRFGSVQDPEVLKLEVESALSKLSPEFSASVDWQLSGVPFYCGSGRLLDAVTKCVHRRLGHMPILSTGGGTSDGRFIAPTGAEVIELGVVNESIHSIDERVRAADLPNLANLYFDILEEMLA